MIDRCQSAMEVSQYVSGLVGEPLFHFVEKTSMRAHTKSSLTSFLSPPSTPFLLSLFLFSPLQSSVQCIYVVILTLPHSFLCNCVILPFFPPSVSPPPLTFSLWMSTLEKQIRQS